MFDQLLLKTIGTRLVEPGDCPYDPRCSHAIFGRCAATRDELQEKETAIKAAAGKEEPLPNVIYVLMDPDKRWPCVEAQTYVLLLPDLEGVGECD